MTFKVGELHGYRAWRISSPYLIGPIFGGPWLLGEPARNLQTAPPAARPKDFRRYPRATIEQTIRGPGYHAMKAPIELVADPISGFILVPVNNPFDMWFGNVCGRIEAWGTVVEGPWGFRAEYARPTHLCFATGVDLATQEAILYYYETEVISARELMEMIRGESPSGPS
jgi:hypothetical protein